MNDLIKILCKEASACNQTEAAWSGSGFPENFVIFIVLEVKESNKNPNKFIKQSSIGQKIYHFIC